MSTRTMSTVAALAVSAALLAASPASAERVAQIERDVTGVVAQASKISPRVAERTAVAVTTAVSTTMSPRVAERLGTTKPRIVSPRMAERGHE